LGTERDAGSNPLPQNAALARWSSMRNENSPILLPTHALGAGQLLAWGATFYSVPTLLPRIAAERGLSITLLSLAITIGLIASALASVFVSAWIERRGARLPMVLGTVGAIFALVVLAIDARPEATMAALILLGASHASLLYEPVFAAIALHVKEERERVRAVQLVTLWGGFAGLWAIPSVTVLATAFGCREALLAMACSLLYPLSVHARLPRFSSARREARTAAAHARCSPNLPLIVFSLSSLAITAVTVHGQSWLTASGENAGAVAWGFALLAPAQVLGRLGLLRLSPARAVGAAPLPFMLIAAGLLSLLALPKPWNLPAFIAGFGAGSGLATTARATVLSASPRSLGAAAFATSLSRAAAPSGAAWLYASSGYSVTLLTFTALLIVGAMLLWRITNQRCCIAEGGGPCFP
jgi:predicted MFS family arabinose efflux permease